MSLPLLQALSQAWPEARVHVVIKVEHASVLDMLPSSNHLVIWHYNSRKQNGLMPLRRFCREMREQIEGEISHYLTLPPSLSSALMGVFLGAKERVGYPTNQRGLLLNRKVAFKSGLHRARSYFRLLEAIKPEGIDFPSWKPDLLLGDYQPPFQDYLVLNPNSRAISRTLPREKWLEVLQFQQCQNYVLTGSPAEAARTEELVIWLTEALPGKSFKSVAGKTDVVQMFQLLQASSGLITNDSGPAHVAHMLGVPMVVFFGAGDYQNTGPGYASGRFMVLDERLECSPCLRNDCPLGTLDCLSRMDMRARDVARFFAPPAPLVPKPRAAATSGA